MHNDLIVSSIAEVFTLIHEHTQLYGLELMFLLWRTTYIYKICTTSLPAVV